MCCEVHLLLDSVCCATYIVFLFDCFLLIDVQIGSERFLKFLNSQNCVKNYNCHINRLISSHHKVCVTV